MANSQSSIWHNRHKEQLRVMENNGVFPKPVIHEQPLKPDLGKLQSQNEVLEFLAQKGDVNLGLHITGIRSGNATWTSSSQHYFQLLRSTVHCRNLQTEERGSVNTVKRIRVMS